jgi:hypothetical protein
MTVCHVVFLWFISSCLNCLMHGYLTRRFKQITDKMTHLSLTAFRFPVCYMRNCVMFCTSFLIWNDNKQTMRVILIFVASTCDH